MIASVNKFVRALAVCLVFGLGSLMVAAPAQAATSSLSGTVNCNGSWAVYNTVRKTTQYGTTLNLTKAAGSAGNLAYYPNWSMNLGVYIVALQKNHVTYYPGAGRNYTLQNAGYVLGTRFQMIAQMAPSHGTCSNAWAGSLQY